MEWRRMVRSSLILALLSLTNQDEGIAQDCAGMQGRLELVYPPQQEKPWGVLVLSHAFNVNPERLADLIEYHRRRGLITVKLSLSGHLGDYAAMEQVEPNQWRLDSQCAALKAEALAKEINGPLYFFGISLSALLEIDRVKRGQQPLYAARVMLVPALSLRWYTHLMEALRWVPFASPIRSRSPELYRVYDRLPLSAYAAVFQTARTVRPVDPVNYSIPTLIYGSDCDELVDGGGLQELVRDAGTGAWRYLSIDNRTSSVKPHYCHLVVDEASMGSETWQKLLAELDRVFTKDRARD